jgi:rubrerythrin
MTDNQDFTTLEVLSIGIKSEIEAIKLYTRMKEMTKNRDLADKFDFLIAQEQRHQKILTDAYNQKFPEVELRLPPKSLVPTISEVLAREASLEDLFDAAMTAEKMSEEFYHDLAGKTRDQNSKSLLNYLASMEHSHYTILEVEYQQLQMGEDINSDDYLRGERLMNLGP